MIRMILIGTGVVYGSVYGALLALILTAWAARTITRKIRSRRVDREWAAGAHERVRTAEYLHWLEDEFTAMDAGECP